MTTASDTAKDKARSGGFNPLSRDNIEALTMAIIMAVMLKYFIVEAYKIPTGSMQPTLMGNDETGIFDRIIVDKLSYHFRDPERFEVAVFKYPLDRSKNFIKRICGMPGEEFAIRNGDLFARPDDKSESKILRRPRPVQMEVWKRINPAEARFASWKPLDGLRTWRIDGRAKVSARGDGAVRLPNDGRPVFDDYRDGYPVGMGSVIKAPGVERLPVGDLRLEGTALALAGCGRVAVELHEGSRRYTLAIPGPAAATDARAHIRADIEQDTGAGPREAFGTAPYRLPAGKSVSFAAQNMDDLLQLEIDGDIVATLEIPETSDQTSSFTLRVEGEGADFDDLEIYRDIHYTTGRIGGEFKIPADSYLMLGDNTQNSSDSREWQLVGYRWSGPDSNGALVQGNFFEPSNPYEYAGEPGGPRIFLRDVWGELHHFKKPGAQDREFERAPYVPRNLVVGRAVIVFWPQTVLSRLFGTESPIVWRLKWIH